MKRSVPCSTAFSLTGSVLTAGTSTLNGCRDQRTEQTGFLRLAAGRRRRQGPGAADFSAREPVPLAGYPHGYPRVPRHVNRFRLQDIRMDILESLYESLIDPETRHDLGEYYTPDWLAARMVAACGSGMFLFHLVRAGLWVGGKVATQQDLAGYFHVRSALLYLRRAGRIALVMLYAALSCQAWALFRKGE